MMMALYLLLFHIGSPLQIWSAREDTQKTTTKIVFILKNKLPRSCAVVVADFASFCDDDKQKYKKLVLSHTNTHSYLLSNIVILLL